MVNGLVGFATTLLNVQYDKLNAIHQRFATQLENSENNFIILKTQANDDKSKLKDLFTKKNMVSVHEDELHTAHQKYSSESAESHSESRYPS